MYSFDKNTLEIYELKNQKKNQVLQGNISHIISMQKSINEESLFVAVL